MSYETDNQGTALVVIAWVLFSISSLTVGLRFWVRYTRVHRIAVDDWLILTSSLFECIHTSLVTVAYTYGMGRHISILSDFDRMHAIKWIITIQFFAITTSMFGRISFATFLLQLVGPTKRWQKAFLLGVIVTQLVVTIPTLIQIYTQCGAHLSAIWDPEVAAHTTCESPEVQVIIGFVQSGLNSLCDLVLTILPCFILWQLHMPIGTKIGLGAVLTLSVFALAASIVKAVEIKNLGARSDYTWAFVNLTIWVCVENNVVITAASIPTLRPIMKRHGSGTIRNSWKERVGGPSDNSCYSGGQDTFRTSTKFDKRGSDSTWLGRGSFRNKPSIQSLSVTGTGTGTDACSEEFTLQSMDNQQIIKTTDVSIAYESQPPEVCPRDVTVPTQDISPFLGK